MWSKCVEFSRRGGPGTAIKIVNSVGDSLVWSGGRRVGRLGWPVYGEKLKKVIEAEPVLFLCQNSSNRRRHRRQSTCAGATCQQQLQQNSKLRHTECEIEKTLRIIFSQPAVFLLMTRWFGSEQRRQSSYRSRFTGDQTRGYYYSGEIK